MFCKRGVELIRNVSSLLRLCHSNSVESTNFLAGLHAIKTVEKIVDPFAKICIETPMHLKIVPVNLDNCPNGDKLIMSLFSNKDEGVSEFAIKPTSKTVEVIGIQKNASSDAVCFIQAPIRASFDIQGTGISNILIEGMHSDICNLKNSTGYIKLKNLRGKSLQIRSDKGCINCEGTLQAENIDISAGALGDITCQHIRSNTLNLRTYKGNISIDSCYSDTSQFTSVMGSLKLSNVHKVCTAEILERGDLQMTGFDGTLTAFVKRGNVNIQASRLFDKSSVFVHDVGTVDIRVPETFTNMCLIDVIAQQMNLEEELLKFGCLTEDALHKKFACGEDKMQDNVNELLIDCRNGSVNVGVSSWKKMIESKYPIKEDDPSTT